MSKDLACNKEEIKRNNIIKQYKNVELLLFYKRRHMGTKSKPAANFQRILILRGSGSGKTNALTNLIIQQLDIDKIYLYAKDTHEE